MQIIALINQKGGMAKTTYAINKGAKINRYCVKSQPTNSPFDIVFYFKYFKETRQQHILSYLYT